ncbi:MAG: peptide-methionine (S)-S-oxide reductase MsrA, partial [Vampirovibrionales bacterium]
MSETFSTSDATIYLGAGCFWGVEHALQQLEGVLETKVGYMGGTTPYPTYEEVCSKTTHHAEVVKVVWQEAQLSLPLLLHVFFHLHDPTQLNRQGPDIGTQYRSCIFTTTEAHTQGAIQALAHAQKSYQKPIVTEVIHVTETTCPFWEAETYHQA